MSVITRAMKGPSTDSNKGTASKLGSQAQSYTSDDLSDEWKIVSRSRKRE